MSVKYYRIGLSGECHTGIKTRRPKKYPGAICISLMLFLYRIRGGEDRNRSAKGKRLRRVKLLATTTVASRTAREVKVSHISDHFRG